MAVGPNATDPARFPNINLWQECKMTSIFVMKYGRTRDVIPGTGRGGQNTMRRFGMMY